MSNESGSAKTLCAKHLEKCLGLVVESNCFEVTADELVESWARKGAKKPSFSAGSQHRDHANWLLKRSVQLRDKLELGKRKAQLLKSRQ